VLIGVVMMDGWPIAHHVFAGNRLDQTTVAEVVEDLRRRFGLQRVVFVGDRGIAAKQ
jgi:transposase